MYGHHHHRRFRHITQSKRNFFRKMLFCIWHIRPMQTLHRYHSLDIWRKATFKRKSYWIQGVGDGSKCGWINQKKKEHGIANPIKSNAWEITVLQTVGYRRPNHTHCRLLSNCMTLFDCPLAFLWRENYRLLNVSKSLADSPIICLFTRAMNINSPAEPPVLDTRESTPDASFAWRSRHNGRWWKNSAGKWRRPL